MTQIVDGLRVCDRFAAPLGFPTSSEDARRTSCFARIAATGLEAGRRIRRHDAWIAATELRHRCATASRSRPRTPLHGVHGSRWHPV